MRKPVDTMICFINLYIGKISDHKSRSDTLKNIAKKREIVPPDVSNDLPRSTYIQFRDAYRDRIEPLLNDHHWEVIERWALADAERIDREAEVHRVNSKLIECEDRLQKCQDEALEIDKLRHRSRTGRHIVVFLDGTNNTPEELSHVGKFDLMNPPPITNVVRLMRGVVTDDAKTVAPQIVGYFRGIGTDGALGSRLSDGLTGHGLSRIILDAYRFIAHNLEWPTGSAHPQPGLDKIFIFGFSRGAYAARALSGFLNRLGLIKKEKLWLLPFFFRKYQMLLKDGGDFDPRTEAIWQESVYPEFRSIRVHFLGVWDTVAALGIPVRGLSWLTTNYEDFHNTSLTPNVSHAYHALAIHELRFPFRPVFWTNRLPHQTLEQVWFTGAHANIGGGYSQVGLSSYALDWLAYKAFQNGLALNVPYLKGELRLDFREKIALSRKFNHGNGKIYGSANAYLRPFKRPISHSDINLYIKKFSNSDAMPDDVFNDMMIHWSVDERLNAGISHDYESTNFASLDRDARALPVVRTAETL